MQTDPIHVLALASWYPNEKDVQWGVFYQKMLYALPPEITITVLHFYTGDNLNTDVNLLPNGREIRIQIPKAAGWKRPLAIAQRLLILRRFLRKMQHPPDLVHLLGALPSGWLLLLSPLRHLPLIYSESWSGWLPQRAHQRSILQIWLFKQLCRRSIRVLPVSTFLMDGMKQWCKGERFEIVPNVIGKTQNPSVILDIPPFILFVGDFYDDVKNVTGLLRVYSQIPIAESLELYLIGDGPDRALIETKIKNLNLSHKVKLLGRLSQEDVHGWMAKCAFGVINSRFETFGMTVLEFAAHNKPVISTRCGGPETFWEEDLGELILPDNDENLHLAMCRMMDDYHRYQPAKRCSELLKRHSPGTIGAQLADIYRKAKTS